MLKANNCLKLNFMENNEIIIAGNTFLFRVFTYILDIFLLHISERNNTLNICLNRILAISWLFAYSCKGDTPLRRVPFTIEIVWAGWLRTGKGQYFWVRILGVYAYGPCRQIRLSKFIEQWKNWILLKILRFNHVLAYEEFAFTKTVSPRRQCKLIWDSFGEVKPRGVGKKAMRPVVHIWLIRRKVLSDILRRRSRLRSAVTLAWPWCSSACW